MGKGIYTSKEAARDVMSHLDGIMLNGDDEGIFMSCIQCWACCPSTEWIEGCTDAQWVNDWAQRHIADCPKEHHDN